MTKKIAYLTGEYPKASHTFIQREIAELRKLGMEVLTCSVRRTAPEHLVGDIQRQEFDKTYHLLQAARSPLRLVRSHFKLLRQSPKRYFSTLCLAWKTRPPGNIAALYQLFYFAEAGVLARHLQDNSISHLHNHFGDSSGSVTMLAAALADIPFSYTMHGPTLFLEAKRWRIDEKTARAKFVICISHFCRSQAMLFSDEAHWDKFHIVHCGVLPDNYGRTRKTTPGKNFLFVGRLAAVKGLPILFEAFLDVLKQHPDAILTLIGDGPDRVKLQQQVKQLGLEQSVLFTGYQTEQEVAAHLEQTDAFVLPSFAEGVPVVLMEAMASKVPVIATRIAGIQELVTDGHSGHMVPPGDIRALSGKMCDLLKDPKHRDQMGAFGRRTVVADFDIAKETRWLFDILMEKAPAGQLRPKE
ncbi:glycosyltransferase family 4 protein [Roseovarius sp. EL26]|uniref:glycosyltransferase family 4 protein n=1 Tax=Roseovarius sp. EL26 TaxID=2126672 RepID=UPI0020B16BFE|nr:glycosyltransferase family 4 protein [Roseovarius sp. EL26]